MQAEDPVYKERHFGWVLTRYADVAAVLRASHSAHRPLEDEPVPKSLHSIEDKIREVRRFQSLWMLYADPPQHTRLRALVGSAFTPRTVERLRARVQSIVDALLADADKRGGIDVVRDLAYPLPTSVIAELLGLPTEDRDLLKRWSDDIAAGFFLVITRDTLAAVERAFTSQNELADYLRQAVRERRRQPRGDLLSALVTAEDDGSLLSEDELLATCVLLLFAGHETTTNLIGNGMLALLEHPDQLRRLEADPDLLPNAVEELLRFAAPFKPQPDAPWSISSCMARMCSRVNFCCWCWERRTEIRLSLPMRIGWTSADATIATWLSGTAFTSAWARRLPEWKLRSRWERSSAVFQACGSDPHNQFASPTFSCAA
jgi:cytochrome P450